MLNQNLSLVNGKGIFADIVTKFHNDSHILTLKNTQGDTFEIRGREAIEALYNLLEEVYG